MIRSVALCAQKLGVFFRSFILCIRTLPTSLLELVFFILLPVLKVSVNSLKFIGYEWKSGEAFVNVSDEIFLELMDEYCAAVKRCYLLWLLFGPIRRIREALTKASPQGPDREDV